MSYGRNHRCLSVNRSSADGKHLGQYHGGGRSDRGIFFGTWNAAIEALVVTMLIDYISGVIAAYVNPSLSLNSQRGFRGILKKIMILLLVSLGHFMDYAMHQQIICTAVVWFFLGNEGLSIVENAAKAGVPIPAKLRETLEQLTEEKEERKN